MKGIEVFKEPENKSYPWIVCIRGKRRGAYSTKKAAKAMVNSTIRRIFKLMKKKQNI